MTIANNRQTAELVAIALNNMGEEATMNWESTQEQLEIIKEDAHLVDSGLLDKEITKARQEWYGIVRWHPEDVIAAAASNGVEMTFEQAVAWWEKNEQAFVDRMTEAGNDILSYMDFE
ncbi:hypothetical protein GYA27_00935 [candidate division WWE3 bacterium]|uniref:Uncharacterized protein n=1 Tax=candidate division WWE3 bacterium TaxID=2053526 RepID=A0A7X9DJS4_UNCKA|nr:hypothetical protein [candidate division WWE3 bacterium]